MKVRFRGVSAFVTSSTLAALLALATPAFRQETSPPALPPATDIALDPVPPALHLAARLTMGRGPRGGEHGVLQEIEPAIPPRAAVFDDDMGDLKPAGNPAGAGNSVTGDAGDASDLPGPPGQRILPCDVDAQAAHNVADIIQDCVNRAPQSGVVELPPGRYVLNRQIVVSKPLTIRTGGAEGSSLSCVAAPERCATLVASPDFFATFGFLLVHSTSDVLLEHLVLDGNRTARVSSAAAGSCQSGLTRPGFNAAVIKCFRCAVNDVLSRNALCGTGMVWSGAQATIERSEFSSNGDATLDRMWADGLTVVYAPDSIIRANRLVDNSDIGLIVGYAVRSSIERNIILQRQQSAFAGLMLDNFGSDDIGTRGDFRGSEFKYNVIDCGPQLCLFGIQVGPRPWGPSKNIIGGDIHHNDVRGAKVGINADGAGIPGAPVAIFANTVSRLPDGLYFAGCGRFIAASWMNIAPTSVINRHDEFTLTRADLSDPCQFVSPLAPALTQVALPSAGISDLQAGGVSTPVE